MESPTAAGAGRAGNVFALNYAISAAAGALVGGWEHGDGAASFARGALFIGACEADAGSPAAGTFLRGVVSRRINHSRFIATRSTKATKSQLSHCVALCFFAA